MTIKVTINCMGGCWHSKFFALISPKLQLIFISSYTPITHGRNILFRDKKASVQFAALLEPFCSKLLSDCTEFNPEILFSHYYTVFTRLAHKDMWHFMYTFKCFKHKKGALEHRIKSNFVRFLNIPPC